MFENTPQILLTGASGYIGGTVLNLLLSSRASYPAANIHCLVRSPDVASKIELSGVKTIISSIEDLDQDKLTTLIADREIDIVLHIGSSPISAEGPIAFLTALSDRKQKTGKEVVFLNTSGTTNFSDATGWDLGRVNEGDDELLLKLRSVEDRQQYGPRAIVLGTDDFAKKVNVKTYQVKPSLIYGTGSGMGNRLSVSLPSMIRAAIKERGVKDCGKDDAEFAAIHIDDLARYYVSLLASITSSSPVAPGIYIATSHGMRWRALTASLASTLYDMGLSDKPHAEDSWENVGLEVASATLGYPPYFIPIIWGSHHIIDAVKGKTFGWAPVWESEEMMLKKENIAKEIEAVLEADKAKKHVTT